jgi:RNA polymerase sigma factor (TIGR02999 family)
MTLMEVTQLLRRARTGDIEARDQLLPLVYAELRRIAAGRLQYENPGHTLQPTALVHEVFLRMFGVESGPPELADRAHFLAVSSQMMRRILVDHARAKAAEKRGGDMRRVDNDNRTVVSLRGREWQPVDFLELNQALDDLEKEAAHLARAIELHHFGGLTAEETALELGRSVHSIRYDLRLAHAWLRRRLADFNPGPQT